jgi:hypothetical protein
MEKNRRCVSWHDLPPSIFDDRIRGKRVIFELGNKIGDFIEEIGFKEGEELILEAYEQY